MQTVYADDPDIAAFGIEIGRPSRAGHKDGAEARGRFRQWLRDHRRSAATVPLRILVDQFGGGISFATAYRIATKEELRGYRHNHTRYAGFWRTINWDLPDSVLATIWGVFRGNIRQRRVRMGCRPPRFIANRLVNNPHFVKAVQNERRRAQSYCGPRPR